jgi:hypothetical protein
LDICFFPQKHFVFTLVLFPLVGQIRLRGLLDELRPSVPDGLRNQKSPAAGFVDLFTPCLP